MKKVTSTVKPVISKQQIPGHVKAMSVRLLLEDSAHLALVIRLHGGTWGVSLLSMKSSSQWHRQSKCSAWRLTCSIAEVVSSDWQCRVTLFSMILICFLPVSSSPTFHFLTDGTCREEDG